MQRVRRLLALTLTLAMHGVAPAESPSNEPSIGFQVSSAVDVDGKAFPIGVWYPAELSPVAASAAAPNAMGALQNAPIAGRRLPLVVISHGNGGGMASHIDLALALARAGYVAAAPVHPGDNFQDMSASGATTLYPGRNRQFRLAIDHLLTQWPGRAAIAADKVGAFGFSAGGFTVLTAAGAQPDMQRIASHCAQTPEFVCEVLRHFKSPLLSADSPTGQPMQASVHIKAVVAAGPGLGFTMTSDSMAAMKAPLQLWSGEKDDKVPFASNAGLIVDALARQGRQVEFHAVPNAGHMSFLAPCGPVRIPELCSDPEGMDRAAFHSAMNAEVIRFFDRHLKR